MPPGVVSTSDLEKRWTFGAWLTLAIALGWLSSVFLVLLSLEQPSDGWTHIETNGGAFIFETHLAGGPSVLQSKDVLIAINGRRLSEHDTPRFPPNLQPGQIIHYTIQRNLEVLNLDVPLVKLGWAALAR